MKYQALVVDEIDGTFVKTIKTLNRKNLPDNEVLIKVEYSALNYKDALSASGHKGITRNFPHTPGIDAAGEVIESKSDLWKAGDKVIVTSYDFGMNTAGGFGELISVPAEWPVRLPSGWTTRDAMIMGTSGFTAALALYKMEENRQHPDMGPILVTGATGALGTASIALLKKAGYNVIASSGKESAYGDLEVLGADEIISREAVDDQSNKPFLSPKWAGAIDSVGGNTLTTILKAAMANANVAVCGLVASPEFSATVYPFIIKGNNLLGIETATCPRWVREKLWENLSGKWNFSLPQHMIREVGLDQLETEIERMLSGKSFGRVILKHQ
ncbi:YhdH/YhfP family quinone oxidoreductase [Luteibaculum oceani]|uniref:Acryloyl-CoA reductase n=1 Tax=Luteibaculum oceani TaxID=1294296 RepID=A0A5C6VKE8_9FLAO|nr:YhdH/YhfP family quinone oxidoreductase [Luteibaculum oceani]TXC85151.1 acryloyl-CoA reductase [Luteibaculum oceani]